jgi:hypothetical protein
LGGLFVLGAVELGSGGTATAVVIIGTHVAVAGFASGFFDIVAGLTDTPVCVPTLSPTVPTAVTLAATRGNISAARTADTVVGAAVSGPSAVKTLVSTAPDVAKLVAIGELGNISVDLITDPNVRDFARGAVRRVTSEGGGVEFLGP